MINDSHHDFGWVGGREREGRKGRGEAFEIDDMIDKNKVSPFLAYEVFAFHFLILHRYIWILLTA